jgi:hypothetical protein
MSLARPLLTVAAFLLAVPAVSGCEQAQERAEEEASKAAANAVKGQICQLVGDGQLTDADISALTRIVDRAHDIGVPAEVLDPAHEITKAGEASGAKLTELQNACG